MSFTQLHPTIPMTTPRGKGYAIGVIDYSTEHNICWVVGLDNGEIWTFQNPEVRMQSNVTMGRNPGKYPDINTCYERLAKATKPTERDYSPWMDPSPNTAQSTGEQT